MFENYVFNLNEIFIRVEREKKNIAQILIKFGGVVESLSKALLKKNLSSLGRGGRELEVPKGHLLLKKTFFFLFFSASQNGLRFMEQR